MLISMFACLEHCYTGLSCNHYSSTVSIFGKVPFSTKASLCIVLADGEFRRRSTFPPNSPSSVWSGHSSSDYGFLPFEGGLRRVAVVGAGGGVEHDGVQLPHRAPEGGLAARAVVGRQALAQAQAQAVPGEDGLV